MKCPNVIIYNLSTQDDALELSENCKSLKSKYTARGQNVIQIEPHETVPENLPSGDIGVYVMGHTKDVVGLPLSQRIFADLFSKLGKDSKVTKINIACCSASSKNGPMFEFCSELVKRQTNDAKLPEGLKVCGFNILLTTFDHASTWWKDTESKKFANFDPIQSATADANMNVRTVQTIWGDKNKREPNLLKFTHEKIGLQDVPGFITDIESAFSKALEEYWRDQRGTFIVRFLRENKKSSLADLEVNTITWTKFSTEHPADSQKFIKNKFWDTFVKLLQGYDVRSAQIWVSLQKYAAMKKVMKFDSVKNNFVPVGLTEYCGNDGIKSALSFMETTANGKGVSIKFMPDL